MTYFLLIVLGVVGQSKSYMNFSDEKSSQTTIAESSKQHIIFHFAALAI